MNTRLGLVSSYSLLYGVRKPEEILDKAASFGVGTVSFCDLNSLYGIHSILEAAKERGIRPIIGLALTAGTGQAAFSVNARQAASTATAGRTPGSQASGPASSQTNSSPGSQVNRQAGAQMNGAVYCFVENRRGFSRLCGILSSRARDERAFDPVPLLLEDSGGLIFAAGDAEILRRLAGKVKHLYSAISPDDLCGVEAHRKLSLPLAFLDTSLFLDKSDYAVHRTLRAIGLNKTTGSLEDGDTVRKGSGIFRASALIKGRLDSWPEAVKGTEEIARLCGFNTLFDGFIFPSYGENPGDELRRRCYEGAALRYGALGDGEIERIEYELNVIEKMGFSPYFLRMDDIVKMARGRTCGRGSGAASIVSYSLGITNVDPIAHNLYFERFLNPSRPDPPDIDVDFAWDERDALIQTVIESFGTENCARVANHNFFRPRSALRETAKAHGIPDALISKLERKMFDLREDLRGSDQGNPEDSLWREIFSIAGRIEGLPRGLGMHCGGLVITPEPINKYAPVEKSREGYPLLAWEKEGAEAAGFVKIDLLGNRSLAVIRDALLNLSEQGIFIDYNTWRPADDSATVEALARGDSMGVFYIESPAMRQLQKKTGVGDFAHIVIHSSLIRPAANKFISEYVKRLKGKKWEPLHPRLEKILDESYGILCYQEDVSKTAIALAGFGEADADKLRKVIAKKAGGAKLAVYEKQFFEGCEKNKIPEETVKSIWGMMLSFDGYSFCKPHSASYAMVSFQSAFLRVHHPAEFMAAVLSNQGGYYRPGAYISESRRMGLNLEGPDLNASRRRYYGCGGRLVIGLMAVKGLSSSGAEKIIKERDKGGPYKSLEDFSRRVKPGRDDIIALCPAGVFDSVSCGLSRAMQARRLLALNCGNSNTGQDDLFAAEATPAFETRNRIAGTKGALADNAAVNKANENELWQEFRSLGFLRNRHTLALWKEKILPLKRIRARDIEKHTGRSVMLLGWPITQKEVWTKDGLTMSFLSLEDETGMYETVIFPDVYERYNKLLFDQEPLLIYGKPVSDEGAVSVEVAKIKKLI